MIGLANLFGGRYICVCQVS